MEFRDHNLDISGSHCYWLIIILRPLQMGRARKYLLFRKKNKPYEVVESNFRLASNIKLCNFQLVLSYNILLIIMVIIIK